MGRLSLVQGITTDMLDKYACDDHMTHHMTHHMTIMHVSLFRRIPGRLNDRRTPLGELNWVFTAITDTIAWNCLPMGEWYMGLWLCVVMVCLGLMVVGFP